MTTVELRAYQESQLNEGDIQASFVKWLDAKKIYYEIGLEGIFLPNPHPKNSRAWKIQSGVNRGVLAKVKREGFRKGPADVKVYLKNIVLHIELKKLKNGRQSDDQKRVEKIISELHYCKYILCKGITQAKEAVEAHINY